MIDTHAHLSKSFYDAPKVEGIEVILAASNLEDSKENIQLAKANTSQFFASVGIHPENAHDANNLKFLEDLVKNNLKLISAIGETGLDFYSLTNKEEQEELFRGQITIALKYDLPLIIHSRKSMEETLGILKEYKDLKGVIHCYTGGKKRIKRVLELGENWYFGIDGNLTYEDGLAEVVANIPKDRLVLETDSPFLTPIPHRGETNKPEYVKYIYEKVAQIWGLGLKETEEIIDVNAKRLFINNQR